MKEIIPKHFISSIEAANEFKKTNDYISLLCRRGKVRGVFAEHQWYVDPSALVAYFAEQKDKKQQRHKELSQQLTEEYRQSLREQTLSAKIFLAAHAASVSGTIRTGVGALVLSSVLMMAAAAPAGPLRQFAAVSNAELPFFGTQSPLRTPEQKPAPTLVESDAQMLPSDVASVPMFLLPSVPNAPAATVASAAPSSPQTTAPKAPAPVIIERLVSVQRVTLDELTLRLEDLYNRLAVQISSVANPGRESPLQNFAVSQVINNLNDVRLGGLTTADDINARDINTSRINATGNASFNGDVVIGGNTSFSGTLSASTTTLATLTVVGGTTLSNATTTNLFASLASTTELFTTRAVIANATSTAFFATVASSTNLFAQAASIGSLSVGSTTLSSLVVSGNSTTTGNAYVGGGFGIGVATSAAGVLQVSSNAYIGGSLFVGGDSVTLGNSTANSLVINSSIRSNLVPDQNITYDLGSPSFFWNNAYVQTLTANNIVANNTEIGGTKSSTFTINSDNVSADIEDSDLIFFRGSVVPNALLSWKSSTDRFEFNQPLFIQNASTNNLTGITLDLKGQSAQTGALFNVASSTGTSVFSISSTGSTTIAQGFVSQASSTVSGGLFTAAGGASTTVLSASGSAYFATAAGNVGVGTTSPAYKLDVTGSDGLGAFTVAGGSSRMRVVPQAGYVTLEVTNAAQSVAQPLVLQASGSNVGIGTTTPASLLSVAGAGYFTGALGVGTNTMSGSLFRIYNTSTPYMQVSDGTRLVNFGIDTSDTTNSTFLNSSNGIKFLTNSGTTQAMTILTSGNVGIGTASPDMKLTLQTAGDAQISFKDSGGTTRAYIGTAGIDGTLPTNGLGIRGDAGILLSVSGSPAMYVNTSRNVAIGNATNLSKLSVGNVGAATNSSIAFIAKADSGLGTTAGDMLYPAEIQGTDGSNLDRLQFSQLRTGNGSNWTTTAWRIQPAVDNSFTTQGSNRGYLEFDLGNQRVGISGAGNSTPDFVVNSSGYVGVGTTNPGAKLAVQVNASNDVLTGLNAGAFTTYRTGSGAWWHVGKDSSSDALVFGNGATPTTTINMAITTSGVGVSTTTPAGKFNVYGGTTFLDNDAASGDQLYIRGASNMNNQLIVGYNTTSNYGNIQALTQGVGYRSLALNGSGGNVGIGTSTPDMKLSVSGTLGVGMYSSSDASLEIGSGATGSHYAILDLTGDTTYTDYGLRLLRGNGGANATSDIAHRGTGNFTIGTIDSAALLFETVDTERMRINSSGSVLVGTSTNNVNNAAQMVISNSASNNSALTIDTPTGLYYQKFTRNGQVVADIYKNTSGGLTFDSYANQSTTADFVFSGGNIYQGGRVRVGYNSAATITNSNFGAMQVLSQSGTAISSSITQDGVATGQSGFAASSNVFVTGFDGAAYAIQYNPTSAFSGTELMRITSAGSVGIGDTNPGVKLSVKGNSGSDSVQIRNTSGGGYIYAYSTAGTSGTIGVWDGASTGLPLLLNAAGGNVGIGTTPTEKLDVNGTLRVSGTGGPNQAGIIALGNHDNGAGYYDTGIYRGGIGALTNDNYLNVAGYNGIAFNVQNAAFGSQATRMFINASGQVGIGTTNIASDALLQVTGSNNGGIVQRLGNSSSGSSAYAILAINSDNASNLNLWLNSTTRSSDGGANTATLRNDAGSLRLQSSGGNGITILTSSGNVGVGDTDPGNKLTVGGDTTSNILGFNVSGTDKGFIGFGSMFGSATAGTDMMFRNDASSGAMVFGFSGTERMRLANGGQLLIGTTTLDTNVTSGIAPMLNVQGAGVEINNFATNGTENNDWPQASLSIRRFDDFTTMRMLQLGHKSDNTYQTGTNVWNFSLVDNSGSKATSDSNTALAIDGPGKLLLVPSGGGNVGIGTASPGAKLDVIAPDNSTTLHMRLMRSSQDYGLDFINNGSTGTSYINYAGSGASLIFQSNGTDRITFDSSGNVTAPGTIRSNTGFNVNGTAGITGSNAASVVYNGNCAPQYHYMTGSITFTGGLVTASSNYTLNAATQDFCDGDIAEDYGTEETVVRGDIVAFGSTTADRDFRIANPNTALGEATTTMYTIRTSKVRLATAATRDRIVGAVPTSPMVIGMDKIKEEDNAQRVALVGHVPIKMTLDGGDVHIGDPITVSDTTPGWGMKALTSGRIVGWALENFSATSTSDDGMIEVYIKPQDWISPQDWTNALAANGWTATSTAAELTMSQDATALSILSGMSSNLLSAIGGLGSSVVHMLDGAISATTGIFNVVFAKEVNTDKLCVSDDNGKTCVTRTELDSLLAGVATSTPQGGGNGGGGGDNGNASSTPPVITLIGADPAEINVGDVYSDLGVTVESVVSPNIGYTMSLDGATSTTPAEFYLDTSEPGTHIILYSATDQNNQTGTATRTVIIQ